jgi:hypothetical protein
LEMKKNIAIFTMLTNLSITTSLNSIDPQEYPDCFKQVINQ